VYVAFPRSDYYVPSATSQGHWLFGKHLLLAYFPSALTFLEKLPVFEHVRLKRDTVGGVFWLPLPRFAASQY
jgi:hypothetical protein